MTVINATKGIIQGASSSALLDVKDNPWTGTALKVSHLLMTTCQTLSSAGMSSEVLSLAVTTAWTATPGAILADSRNVAPFSDKMTHLINLAYQTGIIVNCVAMLALGHPAYALASLSVLAFNAMATGQAKDVFEYVKQGCAAISLAAYGSQFFANNGALASMAAMSAVLIGVKGLLIQLERSSQQHLNDLDTKELFVQGGGKLATSSVEAKKKIKDLQESNKTISDPVVSENGQKQIKDVIEAKDQIKDLQESKKTISDPVVSENGQKQIKDEKIDGIENTTPWYFKPMFS